MKHKFSSAEIVVHVFSIIIILMAGYYYLERMIPFDGAFYSFRIAETGWFCIDNYRYSQHAQLLPLLLLKLGCSLKTFLISYSISFALCNYIIALIILYVYKNQKLALGLILASVLSYMCKFFYPVSEIHSTTAPLFLFAAHVFNYPNRKNDFLYFLIMALIITWTLFIHVISLIPAMFVLAYFVAYTKKLKENLPVLFFASIYWIVGFMLSKTFLTTDYLSSKMIGLKELIQFIKNPNDAAGYIYFKEEFLMNYLPLEILSVSCFIFLLLKKEWLQVLVFFLFTTGTWFIIMAYNLKHDAPIVLINYYGLFGFYAVFPFCMYASHFISNKKFILFYSLLMISSLLGIIRCGALFTDQINYLKRVSHQMEATKGIIHSNNIPWDCTWMSWNFSCQSLILSSLENTKQVKTFCNIENNQIAQELINADEKTSFYTAFFAPKWLTPPFKNKKFFNLSPSNYKWLNTIQDSLFNDSLLSNKNIQIHCNKETIYLLKNNFRFIPVTIVNQTNSKIPSTNSNQKQLNLTYRVFNSKNEMIFHDGKRSTLELDILPNSAITTGLCIDCTQLHRGNTYFLDISMVIENKRWLDIKKRVKVILI